MKTPLILLAAMTVAGALVVVAAAEKPDPQIALDSKFPDPGGAAYFAGELTLVEHVNRRGILRLDRDGTINKYHWDLPHHFQMLPYGAVYFHGAPAELKHVPVGTHLHGAFYLGPEGDFEVTPPVSGYAAGKMPRPDLRSVETKYSRVLRFEDDFSFYQRQGAGWKILSISESPQQIVFERVLLTDGSSDPAKGAGAGLTGEQTFRVDEGTRVWKDNGFGSLADLEVGQIVQLNLGWVSLLGSYQQDGLCREIWIDEASRSAATERQQGVFAAHLRRRGAGATVIKTEHTPGKGAEGYATVELHAGAGTELLEEIAAAKGIFLRSAEPSLRCYDTSEGQNGHELEVTRIDDPAPGSSGIRIRCRIYEMVEGIRAGRTVRVGVTGWVIPEPPREEKLWPNDIRIFSVGPKHITDRDGPPVSGKSE